MNHQISCTTEELAVLVSVCGYHEFAKGIAVGSYGDRTEEDWNLVFQITIPHLILKQIWDERKDEEGEFPLNDNMQSFIKSYVESKRMIRCSDAPNMSAFLFHKVTDNGWLAHTIYKDIIHEFSYVETEEIPKIIKNYYSFEISSEFSNHEFCLSDEDFDTLSKYENANQVIAKYETDTLQRESFEKFIHDLKENNWSLFNISNFALSDKEEDTYLENIVFFLPSTNGVWVAEYTDNPVTPVSVRLNPADEWYQVINGVGFVAASSSASSSS
ncbi:hypothetical protein CEF21_21285 [Bacillus sp. FJAT-42376]|uniref:hypothetical protein n=1 Tax=Bacillus sp. FJAT-42376 TaxID=2014076 RepID=UPI000F4F97DA|nr:hypothetical protein [Bacillus sp. FJAT-42376]AZB44616.1 hypothetical protein CEF21_21285 [Bacillus sp. FJAT-42376]